MILDTPWMPRLVPTASLGGAVAASTAEVTAGTDNAKFITPAALEGSNPDFAGGTVPEQVAASANTRAPRGGVAFDGTADTRAYSTLTGQNIGTDPFSISVVFQVPAANPSAILGIIGLGSSATLSEIAYGLEVRMLTNGALDVLIFGASTGDYNKWQNTGVRAEYSGKTVHLAIVRNSAGDPTVYVNGVALAGTLTSSGTFPTWQGSLTTTYLHVGFVAAAYVFNGPIHSATLYNLALSAADVLEIAESGGAVPYRFQYGSQAGLLSTAASTFTGGGWTDWYGSVSIAAGVGNFTGAVGVTGVGNYGAAYPTDLLLTSGKQYRLKADVNAKSAANIVVAGGGGNAFATFATATGAGQTLEFTEPSDGPNVLGFGSAASAGTFTLDNIVLQQIGAVVHLPLDDGIGYQLHDASTNKLDAVMTTTGAAHLIPKREGYVRETLTWAAATDGKTLIGQRCLPPGAVVNEIIVLPTASTAGTGLAVDDLDSSQYWVARNALTANTKKILTKANRIPGSSAAGDHQMNVYADDGSNPYTGSIQVEVQYQISTQ